MAVRRCVEEFFPVVVDAFEAAGPDAVTANTGAIEEVFELHPMRCVA